MKRFVKMIWGTLFVLMTAIACSDDMNQGQPATVVDALAADPQFSSLVDAVGQAGLTETLSGPGPFTVFAPTNDAFAALPASYLADVTLDQLLTYHVLGSQVDAATAIGVAESGTPRVETLETSDLELLVDGSTLVLNGRVQVTQTDIMTGNGIIHVIDAVLFPDKNFPGNLVEILGASPRFSTLLGAVGSYSDLVEALSGNNQGNNFTLFAPTNSGFGLLPDGVVAGLSSADLKTVLQYHVLGSEVDAAAALSVAESSNPSTPTLTNEVIDLALDPVLSLFVNAGSQVTTTDITVTNGVMHVLDSVLLPENPIPVFPGNLVEALSAYPRFSGLVAAVGEAGLVAALTGVTVFAPTNLAFETAGVPPYPSNLAEILTYHVLSGLVFADELMASETTVEGSNIDITLGPPVLLNGEIEVLYTDLEASDGIIHVIDGVLLPPSAP